MAPETVVEQGSVSRSAIAEANNGLLLGPVEE